MPEQRRRARFLVFLGCELSRAQIGLTAIMLLAVGDTSLFAQATRPTTEPATEPATQNQPVTILEKPERFSVHAQATVISQIHDVFHAPYEGLNSLPRDEGWKT